MAFINQGGITEEYLSNNVSVYNLAEVVVYDDRVKKDRYYLGGIERNETIDNVVVIGVFGGISIEVFLSDDGGKLFDLIESNRNSIIKKDNLIQLFIETNADTFSDKVLRTLVGNITNNTDDIDLNSFIKRKYQLDDDDIKTLLATLFNKPKSFLQVVWEIFTNKIPEAINKVVSKALGVTIDLIDELRLSDSWWQIDPKKISSTEEKTYLKEFTNQIINWVDGATERIGKLTEGLSSRYLKKWNRDLRNVISKLSEKLNNVVKAISTFKEWLQNFIKSGGVNVRKWVAAICGLWNGLVDMVTGLLFIVKMAIDAGGKVRQMAKNSNDDIQRVLEEIDNIYDNIGSIKWVEMYTEIEAKLKAMPQLLDIFFAALNKAKTQKDKAVKAIADITTEEWYYYIGYGVTMIIPVGFVANLLGKAGKAGKTLGKILTWVDKIMNDVFKVAAKTAGKAINTVLVPLKAIAEKIRAGTSAIKTLITDILNKLKEWLESFVGKIGEAGIVVFENLQMKIERISKKVNDKLTEYYLVTYKKKSLQVYFTIIPIQPFILLIDKLIARKVKSNLESLSKLGYEVIEDNGIFYIKKGEIITEMGNAKRAAKELNDLLDNQIGQAQKKLDDAMAWRKKLEDFEIQRKSNPSQYWNDFKYKDLLPPPTPTKKPCFLAGTLIATPNGNIPIENIQAGNVVYCYDSIQKKLTTQAVSEIFSNFAEMYLLLYTENGEMLQVTGQHLFYQNETNTWIKANQLQQGMKLYSPLKNTPIEILKIEVVEEKVSTYNFEVPIHQNYLVSSSGILAHNAGKYKTVNDLSKRKYAFYELFTLNSSRVAETQYIGKTTREDLDIRNSEHKYDAQKKGPKSKHYWKFSEKPQIANLHKGILEMVEMTEIQSAVWEKYFIEENRYKSGSQLRNIQNPISKRRFEALKKSGKHSNICSFF